MDATRRERVEVPTESGALHVIGRQMAEIVRLHDPLRHGAALARTLLEEMQIPDPAARPRQSPHRLSDGQRQSVMIAMAQTGRPDIRLPSSPPRRST